MLRLQIDTPLNRILKLLAGFEKQVNCLSIGHPPEVGIYDVVKSLQQAFVHKAVKKLHFLRGVFKHIIDNIFDHSLCQNHIVFKVSKGDLRLYHPELGRVSCGI